MSFSIKHYFLALLISLTLLVPNFAYAKGNINSKQQAVSLAKSKYKGKVLKAQNAKNGYKVKILQKNGRVITLHVSKKGKIKRSK